MPKALKTIERPAKPDAAKTLADLASYGISVRMLTGDNQATAQFIAANGFLRTPICWAASQFSKVSPAPRSSKVEMG